MVNGVLHKWCSWCKVWNTGKYAHTTEQHRRKNPNNTQRQIANTTQIKEENNENVVEEEIPNGKLKLSRNMALAKSKTLLSNFEGQNF